MQICSNTHTPLRAKAAHSSEMVSMLLFGEGVRIIGEEDEYYFVEGEYDSYQGYVPKVHIEKRLEEPVFFLQNDFVRVPFREGGIILPKGAMIAMLGTGEFLYQGEILRLPEEARLQGLDKAYFDKELLLTNAKVFVGTPYLWGGRTRFGIDCSGFVQLLFKEMGIVLKRDAKDQVLQGQEVSAIAEVVAGDLAFFANASGKVTHVGLLDGEGRIIHSSGQVRVDSVDEKGIFNADLNRYTHELCAIRRYV